MTVAITVGGLTYSVDHLYKQTRHGWALTNDLWTAKHARTP